MDKELPQTDNVCAECGKPLKPNARFCSACGSPYIKTTANTGNKEKAETMKKTKAAYGDYDTSETVFRQTVSQNAPPPVSYCFKCGAPVFENARFCRKCGATVKKAVRHTEELAEVERKDERPSDEVETRRSKIACILMIIAYAVGLVGLIFELTPFLAVSGGPPCGLQLVGAMFGGQSEYAAMGIRYEYLRLAGWAYFAFLLIAVIQTACFALVFTDEKRKNPALLLPMCIMYSTASIVLLAVSSRAQADLLPFNKSLYMGAPGLLLSALASLGVMIAAAAQYASVMKNASERKVARTAKRRPSGKVVAGSIVGAAGVAIAFLFMAAPQSIGAGSDFILWREMSGHSSVVMNDKRDGADYGATIIRLANLEKGGTYALTVETDGFMDGNMLRDSLRLLFDTDVDGATPYEIADRLPIMTNQSTGIGQARIVFDNEYDGELVIAVTFKSVLPIRIGFDYKFERITNAQYFSSFD